MTSSTATCEDNSQSLVRDSVGTTLTNGVLTLVGLIIWVAMARLLDPSWRGALALVMIVPATVMRVGTFGFDQGTVVLGGADRKLLGPLTRTGVVFGFIVGLISIGLFLGFMFGFPKAFWQIMQKVWLPEPFMVITLAFPLHLMTMAYDAAVYAEDRIAARNAKELVVNLVMLAVILAAVLLFDLRLFGVVGAYLIANTVSLGYAWTLVRKRVDLSGGLRFDLLANSIKLGFPVYLAQLASFIMLPAMMLVLSWELPQDDWGNLARIAFFTMGYQIVERTLPVTRSIGFALLPKITGGSEEAAGELASRASRQTLIVAFVLFAVLVLCMRFIVDILLGYRYHPIVGAFAIMAPGGVALSVGGVWATHLLARCKPLKVASAGLAGVLTALIVAAIGFHVLPHGREVLTASIAVVAGSFANSITLLIAFTRTSGVSVSDSLVPRLDDLRDWRRVPQFAKEYFLRRSRSEVIPPL
jgi:O-antigen/teichoic acid export membrane protein